MKAIEYPWIQKEILKEKNNHIINADKIVVTASAATMTIAMIAIMRLLFFDPKLYILFTSS